MSGRPESEIDYDTVVYLRENNFSWVYIANQFQVVPRTLRNWRLNNGYVEEDLYIDGDVLDREIIRYLESNELRGEQMALGFIHSLGFRVTRVNLRASLWKLDPEGRGCRWGTTDHRREIITN